MTYLKPMPAREQFAHAFGLVCVYQKHVLPFVEQRLGYPAKFELESLWDGAVAPIRESDPDDEKYQRAYSIWLWMARCSHDFLADQLDRKGVADYKRLLLRHYKRQQNSAAAGLYYWFNRHASLVNAWAYEMQWMTPIEITHCGQGRYVCEVHDCKVLRTPATERVCKVDCWNVGRELAWQVYHLERHTQAVNHGCTITLTYTEE